MKSIQPVVLALVTTLSGLLAGCGILQPRADLTQFYVLRAQPGAPAAARSLSGSPEIYVGPSRVAGYLENNQIALRKGPNQMVYLDLSRWAEPFSKGIARVLGEDLAARLTDAQMVVYPDPPLAASGYAVQYTVERLEGGSLKDAVILEVSWQVLQRPDRNVIVSQRSVFTVPAQAGADDVAAYVERMSTAIARWADEVAAAIPSD